jgi:tetratricopeptide (TPR) repeat protein
VRRVFSISLVLAMGALAMAADTPLSPCATASGAGCTATAADRKQAREAFTRGLKLEKSRQYDEALHEFESAAELVPQDPRYLTAREFTRQKLVFDLLQRANAHSTAGQPIEALADYRSAIQLDPSNEFAQQQLRDSLGPLTPPVQQPLQVVDESKPPRLSPKDAPSSFNFRGDSRALLTQVATAYGITATIDDSVTSRRVRLEVEKVDFATAMHLAGLLTKSFWVPLEAKQVLVLADTPENRRSFEEMSMRTFYAPGLTTPEELNNLVNSLRTLFDIRFVSAQPRTNTLTVRAPNAVLEAATSFLESLGASRPEVLLDVRAYQVSHTLMRDLGLHIPNQFTLYNIPAAALAGLAGQNIQQLINQIIAGGGINQLGSGGLAGLLNQLGGQQNPIFNTPLATFGNGQTLFGLSLDQLSATLSMNQSWAQSLEHVTLRGSHNKDTSFHLGTRYPILNASFAPIYNTPAIAKTLQTATYRAPFPSVNYEDLGLSIKAKPAIHANLDTSLQLELQFRSLSGQSLNGVPVISNREYKGSITLRNGEPALIASTISHSETRSLSGIPGMGQVPGLNQVTASNSREDDDDDLIIVITPHVLDPAGPYPLSEIWMSTDLPFSTGFNP